MRDYMKHIGIATDMHWFDAVLEHKDSKMLDLLTKEHLRIGASAEVKEYQKRRFYKDEMVQLMYFAD